jgi:hypothetical protein
VCWADMVSPKADQKVATVMVLFDRTMRLVWPWKFWAAWQRSVQQQHSGRIHLWTAEFRVWRPTAGFRVQAASLLLTLHVISSARSLTTNVLVPAVQWGPTNCCSSAIMHDDWDGERMLSRAAAP